MRIAIIERSQILFNSMQALAEHHEIVCVATAREAPEYAATSDDFLAWSRKRDIPASEHPSQLDTFLSTVSADTGISVNYPRIISQDIIDLFPLGILNAHGGDLPRYRGNACQAWAIINGESRIDLCVHRMIGGEVDAGDILARSYLSLGEETYVGDCLDWTERETPKLFTGHHQSRPMHSNPSKLISMRNDGFGVRSLFEKLLEIEPLKPIGT